MFHSTRNHVITAGRGHLVDMNNDVTTSTTSTHVVTSNNLVWPILWRGNHTEVKLVEVFTTDNCQTSQQKLAIFL